MNSEQVSRIIVETATALTNLLSRNGWTDVKVAIDVDAKGLSTVEGSRLRDLFE